MKTTGAVWKEYLDSWPEGQWFDDSNETINGESDVHPVPDDAVVEFTCGTVFRTADDSEGVSLTRHFTKWLKTRDNLTFVVSIPKDSEEAFRDAVKFLRGAIR